MPVPARPREAKQLVKPAIPGNAGVLVLTAREVHVRFYELSSLEPPVVGEYRHSFS